MWHSLQNLRPSESCPDFGLRLSSDQWEQRLLAASARSKLVPGSWPCLGQQPTGLLGPLFGRCSLSGNFEGETGAALAAELCLHPLIPPTRHGDGREFQRCSCPPLSVPWPGANHDFTVSQNKAAGSFKTSDTRPITETFYLFI